MWMFKFRVKWQNIRYQNGADGFQDNIPLYLIRMFPNLLTSKLSTMNDRLYYITFALYLYTYGLDSNIYILLFDLKMCNLEILSIITNLMITKSFGCGVCLELHHCLYPGMSF